MIDGRIICAVLTLACALLLGLRLRPERARILWAALLLAGIVHAVGLTLAGDNLVNINIIHHYLGAKYAFPYTRFYHLTSAALERPRVDMHDLEHPPAMLRADPREQRAYYIDLMRAAEVPFVPTVSLPELRRLAEDSGALRGEAEAILRHDLAAGQVESFRRDARLALADLPGRDITTDYGFNGSPFYALVRHVDPTLYLPFGSATAYTNLAWQVLAALLVAWLTGTALGLGLDGRLAIAALLFSSWDFVGYALPGLIFAGLWLPVALGLLALRRRRFALVGVAVAWAGLIKLFPFILLLPAGVRLVRSVLRRRAEAALPAGSIRTVAGEKGALPIPRWALALVAGCAAATPVLGLAALLSGRSWADFAHKIAVQFQSEGYLLNSVSLSQGLLTIGVSNSPLPVLLTLLALATLAALFVAGRETDVQASLPRFSLVLLAATGLLVHTWFSYYAVAPLLLLPLVAQQQRWGAAAAVAALALSTGLQDFDHPSLLSQPGLHFLKVAPYVVVPAWLVLREFQAMRLGKTARTVAVGVLAVATLATGGEALRQRAIRNLDGEAGVFLDAGEPERALERYNSLVRLAPYNAMAHMNRAIALAGLGRGEAAAAGFARAAALASESAVVRTNHGRWLRRAGRLDEAAAELEAARRLAPHDESILGLLATVRLDQNLPEESRKLLLRVLELQPGDRQAAVMLREIRGVDGVGP